jgi:hydrogenase-4 membrane subunit HyfE
MAHRGIATLAAALLLCFFVLSHFEPEFFLLHLYQSLMYLAVILLLFYSEEQYAYMLGMLAPAAWLLLTYGTGLLQGAARQVSQLLHAQRPGNQVSLMAAVTAVLAVLMASFCAYRWKREYAGLGKGRNTFLVSFSVVFVYYGILVVWFWWRLP